MPTKASITTRTAKGSPLTTAEMDGNLEALRDQSIGFADDTSTVLSVDSGNTITIAGAQNVSTTLSGSTLTITGPDLSTYLTNSTISIVGDDSTGTTLNSGETIKIAGTQNITTAVSGDTLTITGPDLTSYITASSADTLTNKTIGDDLAIQGSLLTDVIKSGTSNESLTLDPQGTGTVVITTGASDDAYPGSNLRLKKNSGGTYDGAEFTFDQYNGNTDEQGLIMYYDESGAFTYPGTAVSGDINNYFGYNFTDEQFYWWAEGGSLSIKAVGDDGDSYATRTMSLDSPLTAYSESIFALTDDSTTDIHIDCSANTVTTFSLNDNKTFVFANLAEGASHTLIITNQGSHTATLQGSDSSAILFPGGAPTITTGAGAIDVITVFYDGTNYLGNIAQNFS